MNDADLNRALDILLNWSTPDPERLKRFIVHFYDRTDYEKKNKPEERWDPIFPDVMSITNHQEFLHILLSQFGQESLECLIIHLLENDNRYVNSDTINNYQNFKPHPSYFIYFAYLLIYIMPKKSRKLFDAFWDHQAKVRPGIDEQCARQYLDPFIEQGITSRKEIQQLLIRDWYRWQEKGYPYYGASLGASTWYTDGGPHNWEKIEENLKKEWEQSHGLKAKEWGE